MGQGQNDIGECFILGFRGFEIPGWLRRFAENHSLGGVIVFDYDCQTKKYENNIQSPAQLKALCEEIHALNGRPMIFIDQEGGKVRRLKESRGFAPLPSQWAMNSLSEQEQTAYLERAYREMKEIGIDVNLAPVIDLNVNPENPDIGKVERSYSAKPEEVLRNTRVLNRIARRHNIGLCLKHYPGLGGAKVNSHLELTDLSDCIDEEQIRLFETLAEEIHGRAILVSHGLIRQWDAKYPSSISKAILRPLTEKHPDCLLLSDDIQMQGLQKLTGSKEACTLALEAGIDMICIGNNMIDQQDQMLGIAEALQRRRQEIPEFAGHCARAAEKVLKRKKMFQ